MFVNKITPHALNLSDSMMLFTLNDHVKKGTEDVALRVTACRAQFHNDLIRLKFNPNYFMQIYTNISD